MKVKSFTFNPLMENSYVIYDETKSCAIIDPGCCCSAEENELKAFIEKEGLKPVLLLNTHLHFDHIWGNPMVMKEYGLKPKANVADKVFLDGGQLQFHGLPEDLNSLRFDVDWIGEGDKLTFGNAKPVDGFMTGAVKYKPFMQLALTTLNDVVTMTIAIRGNDDDKKIVEKFFDLIVEIVKEFDRLNAR